MNTQNEAATPRRTGDLVSAARRAAERAHAPQSGFHVGAAVLDENGGIHLGCNVETSAHTAVHAEEAAIAAWRISGEGRPVRIAICGPDGNPIPPCGMCRQLLSEVAPGIEVLVGDGRTSRIEDLLPAGFGPGHLGSTLKPGSIEE